MIILPKEQPVIQGLNTYYLDVLKLLEHYQGEIGSGGIRFIAPSAQGVLFFDQNEVLSGVYEGKNGEAFKGDDAVDRLIEAVEESNFQVEVYALDASEIHFWANIPSAVPVYQGLSTDFTDLEGLLNKMASEKLTGFIEASLKNGAGDGLIFFINGDIIGGSFSWGNGNLNGSREVRDILVSKAGENGATLNVSKIPPKEENHRTLTAPPVVEHSPVNGDVLGPLQEFLLIFERTVRVGGFVKGDFSTVLKKKFIEKADSYFFLDPFAGEFAYKDGKIRFSGDAPPGELVRGVTESVQELGRELKAWPHFSKEIKPWLKKYSDMISDYGLSF